MQVTVSGRHMAVSDAVKEYCEKKAGRLARFYDRIQSIEVVLDGQNGHHFAEMIVHSEGSKPFVGREEHDDIYAAFDLLLEKVERQIRDHKQRRRNRKHPPRTPESA